jgi:hypothetical protein
MNRLLSLFLVTVSATFVSGCSNMQSLKDTIVDLRSTVQETMEAVEEVTVALEVVARGYGEGSIRLSEKTADIVQKGVERGKKAGATLTKVDEALGDIDDAIPSDKLDLSSVLKLIGSLLGLGLSLSGRNVENGV